MCLSLASSRAATVNPDSASRSEQMVCYPLIRGLNTVRNKKKDQANVPATLKEEVIEPADQKAQKLEKR